MTRAIDEALARFQQSVRDKLRAEWRLKNAEGELLSAQANVETMTQLHKAAHAEVFAACAAAEAGDPDSDD